MTMRDHRRNRVMPCAFGISGVFLVAGLLLMASFGNADGDQAPEQTHDGLVLVPDSQVALSYIKPGADFGIYEKLMILDAYVAFRKGWQRDQMRSSVYRVTTRDMERIKKDTAELFSEVFVEVLTSDDGHEIVDAEDIDVLLIRPAIIDLDVTAPDLERASRTYNYATSAGSATLYLEFYDSVSSEILARVVDTKSTRNHGDVLRFSNKVTNRAEAKKIFSDWANLLRDRLDEVQGKTD